MLGVAPAGLWPIRCRDDDRSPMESSSNPSNAGSYAGRNTLTLTQWPTDFANVATVGIILV
jgi:hypothetical protein